jgi:hypothetical protein
MITRGEGLEVRDQSERGTTLVVCRTDVEGLRSVIPAKAGIQGGSALASGSASWIPGLALLARNDVPTAYPSSVLWWATRTFSFSLLVLFLT